MEEEIIDSPSKLCRICFDNGDYELQKYELLVDNDKMNLKSMLKEFSVFETNDTDNIPSMLCKNCTNELIKCYEFVKKLRKADEQLQKILDENSYYDEQEEYNQIKKSENLNNHNENGKCNELNEYILNDSFSLSENDDDEDDNDKHYIIEYENDEDDLNSNIRVQLKNEKKENLNKIVKRGRKRKVNNSRTPNIVITDNVNNILSKVRKSSNSNIIEIEPSSSSASSIKLKRNLKNSKKFCKKSNQIKKDNEKPYEKFETISNEDRLVITKFVLTNDEITTVTATTNDQDNVNDDSNDCLTECLTTTSTAQSQLINEKNATETSTEINQIRMFDIAPVEVDATQQIPVNNFDDDIETNIENPNTMYKCKYCPKAFSTSHYLILHARKSHCCQFCMKCFTKSEELYKHSREEHNQFKCTLCERDFSSNSNLRQHLKKIHNIILPAHTSILSFKKKE